MHRAPTRVVLVEHPRPHARTVGRVREQPRHRGAETSTGADAQPQPRRQRGRRITRRWARTSISNSDDSSAPFPT